MQFECQHDVNVSLSYILPFFFLFFGLPVLKHLTHHSHKLFTVCPPFGPFMNKCATYLHASEKSHCKLRPPRPNCTCENRHTHTCRAHLYPVNFSSSLMPTCPLSFLLPLKMSYHCLHLAETGCSRKIKKNVPKVLGYSMNYYLRLK